MEEILISTRINKDLQKAVIEYCNKTGLKIKIFITTALINELRYRDARKSVKNK